MGIGFQANVTNITLIENNLFNVANSSNVPEFLVNVNHYMYDGWLFVVLLFVVWIILYFIAQKNNDNLMDNLMTTGAIVSVLSMLMRGIYLIALDSTRLGLLSDAQLWIFPLITILLAMINQTNK